MLSYTKSQTIPFKPPNLLVFLLSITNGGRNNEVIVTFLPKQGRNGRFAREQLQTTNTMAICKTSKRSSMMDCPVAIFLFSKFLQGISVVRQIKLKPSVNCDFDD